MVTESYDDEMIEALRQGDLVKCFGPLFAGIELAESLKLPGGRMKLIHRVKLLDPRSGRFGLGIIRAEADIHPDDWFLTCHFMDDMVMPGTLMYECCAHTLRIFIQRMGWVTAAPDAWYEPMQGIKSVLKCRGPVTPETKRVLYEVEIKEIGYAPEPYIIADALMYADGQRIVSFKDMSMKMTGITRKEIEDMWKQMLTVDSPTATPSGHEPVLVKTPLFDRDDILAFAIGNPSDAFGEPYKIFDNDRFIARLPAPPYFFMDRVVTVEPEAWILKPDGWIETEYDVPTDAWYFGADRTSSMPFCILLEIALQPCGWLAAYMGSALQSKNDLKFRNLGGHAIMAQSIPKKAQTLTIRVRMTKVSDAAEMIIEHFDFQVLQGADIAYSGETYFGFFSRQALSQQVGLRDAEKFVYRPTQNDLKNSRSFIFEDEPPLFPDDPQGHPAANLSMPATALRMIDGIAVFAPNGGPKNLGFIRGDKIVNPDEWFFQAHFHQDPVWPGSLGIESFLQLIKFAAMDRWQDLIDSHTFQPIRNESHNWTYRGQVIPKHQKVEVEAVITNISEKPVPTICADGWLKVDGRYIYQMNNFGFQLVPVDTS
jgi:3-hydroxymyristoyl/3-hydroxydecanoyl-(acyl carrier protein) dehydratase